MADKEIDQKGRGWLGLKLAQNGGKIDRLGLAKKSVYYDGFGGHPVAHSLLFAMIAGMIGGVGGLVSDGSRSDYVQPADTALRQTDTGPGFETIRYASDRPAVTLVRGDDGTLQLYSVQSDGRMTLLSERQAWAVAAEITTVLQQRIAQLNQSDMQVGDKSFLPFFPSYDSISTAWTYEGGYFRHAASGGREVEIAFADLDEKYARELQEWIVVRESITAGLAAGKPAANEVDPGAESASVQQVLQGMAAGAGIVLLGGLCIVGAGASRGYRDRKREALRRNR